MSILNAIKGVFSASKEISKLPAALEGYCPNCWGRSEYAGKFYEAVKNENIDINSPSNSVGWIQEYANKHLYTIKMTTDHEEKACPKCKYSYKTT